MKLLISIAVSIAFILLFEKQIKKHSAVLYVATLVISGISIFLPHEYYPGWLGSFMASYVQRGTIATALFIIVMYAILMPKKSRVQRTFMSLRGEIAIIASLLILAHNVVYGKVYFIKLFFNIGQLQPIQIVAAILSMLMILLLLPLTLTSFLFIRKKMQAKKWKQLQRMSYLFYGLLFLHVAVLFSQRVIAGDVMYTIDMCIYTLIFGIYSVLRIQRYLKLKKKKESKLFAVTGLCIIAVLCLLQAGYCILQNRTVLSQSEGQFKDGVYEGKGIGYNGEIQVKVTVSSGEITNIEIVDYVDDEHFFRQAADTIPQLIVEQQSTDIDAVSGATYSSKGILSAVEDALR